MDYNFGKICRICLRQDDDLTSIFYNETISGDQVSLSNKIMACSSVQVVAGDGLPEMICTRCLAQVDVAYDFHEKSQSADATLRKYVSILTPVLENSSQCDNTVSQPCEETVQKFIEEDGMDAETDLIKKKCKSQNDEPHLVSQNHVKKRRKERSQLNKPQNDTKSRVNKSESCEEVSDKKKGGKGEQDVICPICKKCFAYLCILKDHMVQHTGMRPFLCSSCGKSFAHTASLSNHMKTHYSDKPHKCDRCSLSFHRKAHLILHMRTHTGEKPYVCEVCGRNFAQSSYLKEHMRLHSGEKPFVCDICGHGFARKSCLVMHRRVHTGELPYACPECGRAFSQRSQRKRHVKRNHKGSACLRDTGELILKDLDSKNRNSYMQTEVINENSMNVQNDNLILQRNLAAGRQNLVSVNNANFRDISIFPTDQSGNINATQIPLPLVQIHRTLLQQ